jgi:hypothetical protein
VTGSISTHQEDPWGTPLAGAPGLHRPPQQLGHKGAGTHQDPVQPPPTCKPGCHRICMAPDCLSCYCHRACMMRHGSKCQDAGSDAGRATTGQSAGHALHCTIGDALVMGSHNTYTRSAGQHCGSRIPWRQCNGCALQTHNAHYLHACVGAWRNACLQRSPPALHVLLMHTPARANHQR